MSLALIRQALETRVATWAAAQSPPVTVIFENLTDEKPAGRYAECFLMPAPTKTLDLQCVSRSYVGVFMVRLALAQNQGPAEAQALAASLDAAFPLSAPMVQGGLRVWMTSPMSPSTAIPGETRYTVPVSASYRADQF